MGLLGTLAGAAVKAAASAGAKSSSSRGSSSSGRTLSVGADGKAPKDAGVGDTIVTAGGSFKITGGTPGNWQSEKIAGSTSSGIGGGADYSAIIYDPSTTLAQKQEAYNARLAKEAQMRADGTWDPKWIPTNELRSVINSTYYAQPYEAFPSFQTPESYMDVQEEQNRLARQREEEARRLYQQQVQQGTARLNAQRGTVNQTYEDAARQAYISYMQNQRAIPGQLAAAGITGGAAESTMLGAQTAYQGSLGSISAAKQKALNDIDTAITELQNAGDVQAAQYILSNREKIADNFAQNAYAEIARNQELARYAKEDAYNEAALTGMYNGKQTVAAQQDAYKRAMEFGMLTGDFSMLKQLGFTEAQVQEAYRAFLAQKTAEGSRGGSRGSGGGSRSRSRSTGTRATYAEQTTEERGGRTPLSINPISLVPFVPGAMRKLSEAAPQPKRDAGYVYVPGYGRLTWVEVESMVDRGELIEEVKNGVPSYRKNPNDKKR